MRTSPVRETIHFLPIEDWQGHRADLLIGKGRFCKGSRRALDRKPCVFLGKESGLWSGVVFPTASRKLAQVFMRAFTNGVNRLAISGHAADRGDQATDGGCVHAEMLHLHWPEAR